MSGALEYYAATMEAVARRRPPRVRREVDDSGQEHVFPVDPAEHLRQAQARVRGIHLAVRTLADRLAIASEAERSEKVLAAQPPKEPRTPKTAAQAIEWRRWGELARTLVAEPGWDILVRRIAAKVDVAESLKLVCPPEMGGLFDALIVGLTSPIIRVQEFLDLGDCAEIWFHQQEKESEGGD